MTMIILIIAGVAIVLVLLAIIVRRRRPRKLKTERFTQRWQQLQQKCANRRTWPEAIIEADDLLDEALRKSRFKGKTTGERLVSAQRKLTSNEAVWFGHKLRNRVTGVDVRTLKKQHVLDALSGFRQALRDLGALEVKEKPPRD